MWMSQLYFRLYFLRDSFAFALFSPLFFPFFNSVWFFAFFSPLFVACVFQSFYENFIILFRVRFRIRARFTLLRRLIQGYGSTETRFSKVSAVGVYRVRVIGLCLLQGLGNE